MHGTPTLRVQQIEAYDPIAVDVRVQGDAAVGRGQEDDFGRFDRVGGGEVEAQTVLLCGRVDGIVEHGDVHLPFFQVGRGDECDAWGELALDLRGRGGLGREV